MLGVKNIANLRLMMSCLGQQSQGYQAQREPKLGPRFGVLSSERVCLLVKQTVKIASYRAEYRFRADDNRGNGVKYIQERLPKDNINFYKVLVGIGFSLVWARVMYSIWSNPPFATFIWFYLGVGSMLLKWALFEIIDRVSLRIRIRNMEKELDEAERRRHAVGPKEEG
jgi:hypothetical protein